MINNEIDVRADPNAHKNVARSATKGCSFVKLLGSEAIMQTIANWNSGEPKEWLLARKEKNVEFLLLTSHGVLKRRDNCSKARIRQAHVNARGQREVGAGWHRRCAVQVAV